MSGGGKSFRSKCLEVTRNRDLVQRYPDDAIVSKTFLQRKLIVFSAHKFSIFTSFSTINNFCHDFKFCLLFQPKYPDRCIDRVQ